MQLRILHNGDWIIKMSSSERERGRNGVTFNNPPNLSHGVIYFHDTLLVDTEYTQDLGERTQISLLNEHGKLLYRHVG